MKNYNYLVSNGIHELKINGISQSYYFIDGEDGIADRGTTVVCTVDFSNPENPDVGEYLGTIEWDCDVEKNYVDAMSVEQKIENLKRHNARSLSASI